MFKNIHNPFAFALFLLYKLPSAWFMGLKMVEIEENRCIIGLPFGWRSQNPFRSTYFAAQMAAGEMSTGLLALLKLDRETPGQMSMLVTDIRAEFFKKATERTHFECHDGEKLTETLRIAFETGQPQKITMTSNGYLAGTGDPVSTVWVTWSFKKKF
jgi:Domain of unknown function (DUF4442)